MMRIAGSALAMAVVAITSALVLAAPAKADRTAPDRVCALSWETSSGWLSMDRHFAPDGTLKLEQIGVTAVVSRGSGGISQIAFHEQRGSGVKASDVGPQYALHFYYGRTGPRDLRFEIDTPEGTLVLPADNSSGKVPLSSDQLRQILGASGPVAYRVYQGGSTASIVWRKGTFDVSAFAADDLAGLAALADRGRSALDTASASEDPPCGEDIGSYDVPRRMEITCKESWSNDLGLFEMAANQATWKAYVPQGAALFGAFPFSGGPVVERVDFLKDQGQDTYMSFALYGDDPLWRRNMDSTSPRFGKVQVGEIAAGSVVLRRWLAVQPKYGLSFDEAKTVRQIIAAPGPLSLKIYDVETGLMRTAELADGWQARLTAELRAGLKRLQAKERAPFSQCSSEIKDYEMEAVIVT